MKLALLVLTIGILSACVYSYPIINEVMPRGAEWVEIYNPDGEINLSKWNISDSVSTDQITCHTITNCSLSTNQSYILIIGRSTNISEITNGSIVFYYVDDSSIGNGLNDNGDSVKIITENYSSNFTYNSSNITHSWSYSNNSWNLCTQTPGFTNSCNESIEKTPENSTKDLVESTENTTLSNESIKCDFYPSIISDDIYTNGDIEYKIDIRNKVCGNESQFSFVYWIEDIEGNIVKPLVNTSSSASCSKAFQRSWTENKEGLRAYFIKVNISSECDSNTSNNYAKRLIVVNKKETRDDDSYINLLEYPRNISSNSDVDIKIEAYRGNSNKTSLHIYIIGDEKISNEVVLYIENKFSKNVLKIPIHIKEFCRKNSTNYILIVDGFDKVIEKAININSPECVLEDKTSDISFTPPKIIYIGKEFNSTVILRNTKQDLTLYSYIYSGNKLLSEGLGKGWSKRWDANKIDIKSNDSEILIFLSNRLFGVAEGNYTIRLSITKSGKKEYITSYVEALMYNKSEEIPQEINSYDTNKTQNRITGNVLESRKDNKTYILDSIKNWFFSLFKKGE